MLASTNLNTNTWQAATQAARAPRPGHPPLARPLSLRAAHHRHSL